MKSHEHPPLYPEPESDAIENPGRRRFLTNTAAVATLLAGGSAIQTLYRSLTHDQEQHPTEKGTSPPEHTPTPHTVTPMERIAAREREVAEETLFEQIGTRGRVELTRESMRALITHWYRLYAEGGQEHRNLLHAQERYLPWKPYIEDAFVRQGVPKDLALLSFAESHFITSARNATTGATGPYQFMKETAGLELLGLTVNDIIDERYDPIRSARAAATLLKDNRKHLNNSWNLAISAYNGSFAWHYAKSLTHGERPTYDGFLRFMSARINDIVEKYGICVDLKNTVLVRSGDTLSLLSEQYGIPQAQLMELNDLTSPNLVAGKRLRLSASSKHHVPPEGMRALSGFDQNINYPAKFYGILHAYRELTTPPTPPSLSFVEKRVPPGTPYTVAQGETLWYIAQKSGLSLRDLLVANNLDEKTTIRPGDTLTLPRPVTPQKVTSIYRIPPERFFELNPHILAKDNALPPNYRVRIPA